MAGLLAVLVVFWGLVAASSELHQILHPNGESGSSLCVVCLLVKGQAEATDPGPVLTPGLSPLFCRVFFPGSVVLPQFSYSASASRAPPMAMPSPAAKV